MDISEDISSIAESSREGNLSDAAEVMDAPVKQEPEYIIDQDGMKVKIPDKAVKCVKQFIAEASSPEGDDKAMVSA